MNKTVVAVVVIALATMFGLLMYGVYQQADVAAT
jgi:hypothetical protein